MTLTLIIIQAIIVIILMVELVMLRRNRIVFESLLLKFVELCQGLYDRLEAHNKKLSENVGNLSKTVQNALSAKNDAKVLEGAVKDLQSVSKYIRTGAMKEFKDIEDGIKKIKSQLKQEK